MARGFKTGGRTRGTKNRKTLERERIAAQLQEGCKTDGAVAELIAGASKLLAKNVLEFWVDEFDRLAKYYRTRDRERSNRYALLALDAAKALAPYQSPTYRAIMLAPAMPEQPPRRFTLKIHDSPRLA